MLQTLQWLWLVKIAAGVAFYVVIPGTLVSRYVQPDVNGARRLALSFTLGYVLFANLALAALPFRTTFDLLNAVYALIAGAAVAIPLMKGAAFPRVRLSGPGVFLAMAAICGCALSLLSGWFPRGDASVHLQSIINLVQDGRVLEARYSLVGHPTLPDQGFNAHHLLVALISRTLDVSPDVTWHYLSPVIALFVPSTVLLLVSAVAQDVRLQIYTLTSFLVLAFLFPLLMQGSVFDSLVYPNRIYLWIVIPSALHFLFRYYDGGRRTDLALVAAHMVAFFTVHVEGFLWLVVVTCGVAVLALPWRQTRIHVPVGRSVSAILIVLISAAPFLAWRSEANAAFIEKVTDPIWLDHYAVWRPAENFFALNPLRLGANLPPTIVASVVAFGVYLVVNFYGKAVPPAERMFVLLLAVSFLPLFLVFNPILFPTAMDVVGIVAINRMQRIPLYYFAFGVAVFMAAPLCKRYIGLAWNYRLVSAAVVVGAFLIAVFRMPAPCIDHQVLWSKAFLPYLSRDTVVLADPVTSSDVASMTPATVLSIQFNGAIELRDLSKEKAAVEAFFAGDEVIARGVIASFRPTHVVARAGDQTAVAMSYPFLRPVNETSDGTLFQVIDAP